MVNIYKELYGEKKIDGEVISACTLLLYAERIGEKLVGADLFTIFASKSPFLVENIYSYFLGGYFISNHSFEYCDKYKN